MTKVGQKNWEKYWRNIILLATLLDYTYDLTYVTQLFTYNTHTKKTPNKPEDIQEFV